MSRTMDWEARKAQLAEAVWQVILEQGISSVSVRTVADRAGVAVGSLRHVFPTRAELVQCAAELMVQRATERILAITPKEDPREYVFDIIKSLLPLEQDSRAEFEINLALFVEGTAVPSLIEVRESAHRQLAELTSRLVEMLTGESRTVQARRLHALIDGIAFHLIHQPLESDHSWALDIIWQEILVIAVDET